MLLKRVGQQDRAAFYKTRDKELIKNRFTNEEVFSSTMPHELTLDVTYLSPEESAVPIIQWVTALQNKDRSHE